MLDKETEATNKPTKSLIHNFEALKIFSTSHLILNIGKLSELLSNIKRNKIKMTKNPN